jgi:hypothetical protein
MNPLARRAVVGLTAVVSLVACSGSTPAASPATGKLVAGDSTPPPWPPEVGGPGPNLPDCNRPGHPRVHADVSEPTTPTQLAAGSWQVVVADAVDQRPFWIVADGNWGAAPGGWVAQTVTNFHVVRVLKGHASSWVQRTQMGAVPDSLPCPPWIDVIGNMPPPKVGSRYLLFDYHHASPVKKGRPQPAQGYQGPWWRFVVIDGVVHPEAEFDHEADSMNITPKPLDDFLKSIGL